MKKLMAILEDKIQLVRRDELQNIAVVGPVKLPIKQENLEATFQWYSWTTVEKIRQNNK